MKAFLGLLAVATIVLGQRLPFSIENRIANGLVAMPNEFPFQVGLMMVSKIGKEGREASSWCGGSLIARDVVLTAAHCLDKAHRVTVFLGAHDITKSEEPGRVVIQLDEDNMFVNPDYDTRTAENDIALVKLPYKVHLTDKIQTINLPRLGESQRVLAEKMGIISGWGKMGDANGQSPVLRYANRKITKDRNCEFFFFGFKASTQVCVDGKDMVSACPGDSGGPLTITESDGSKTLVGLTSYGRMEGCERGFPTVYTRVSAFLEWIAANTDVQLRF